MSRNSLVTNSGTIRDKILYYKFRNIYVRDIYYCQLIYFLLMFSLSHYSLVAIFQSKMLFCSHVALNNRRITSLKPNNKIAMLHEKK